MDVFFLSYVYMYKDDDIYPLFSFAYYCKNSACELGGALLWQIDEIKGLLFDFLLAFFFSWYFFWQKLNTHLPIHPCDIHIYHFVSFAHISFFLSYRRKMYLFIVLLSSTCTVYIFRFHGFFFLFVFCIWGTVVLFYRCHYSIYRHYIFFSSYSFIIIPILLWKERYKTHCAWY